MDRRLGSDCVCGLPAPDCAANRANKSHSGAVMNQSCTLQIRSKSNCNQALELKTHTVPPCPTPTPIPAVKLWGPLNPFPFSDLHGKQAPGDPKSRKMTSGGKAFACRSGERIRRNVSRFTPSNKPVQYHTRIPPFATCHALIYSAKTFD